MIDLSILSLIIANNPDVEINIRLTPEEYCRRYPQDYMCPSGRRNRYTDFLTIQKILENHDKAKKITR
jgi:hypothetical protein